MQETDPQTPAESKRSIAGARPFVGRVSDRAQAGMARLQPHLKKIDGELRKHPRAVEAFAGVTGFWDKLVAAFCATIDPYFARFVPHRRLIGVVTTDGDIALHKVGKDGPESLGALSTLDTEKTVQLSQEKWSVVELRLRPDQVLTRTLSLPAASRDFLGPIIEHRLERLTPWRADKVLYGYQIVEGGPETPGTVPVALLAASRDVVERFSGQMASAGFAPTRIGASAEDDQLDQPIPIDLQKHGAVPVRIDSRRMVSRVSIALLGSLTILYALTSWFAASATGEQEAVGGKLMKARMLLKGSSVANAGSREKQLLAAKDPDTATVVLLDRLATAIPEDTYLKELAIAPDKVRLIGTSRNAPALVGKLEGAGLANVRFNAAITREKDLTDSFEITADRSTKPKPDVGAR